ncbi:Indole-3-acetic acid-amido synthetase GH3.17 [Vitis vinifera]|uniref:Indole-3-acetic acid-amido synthetase GH3.17 n=1 Tax=Vitis vinifera TaxID=29760 RepID=A0A438H1C5_VITVI|nr:Indole-3-acetic acid-amido synthetase GH3.17 [Vitis vinifera]
MPSRMLLSCDPHDNEAGLMLLEDLTTNANQVQLEVLEEILTQNANTEYLRGYLDGHSDKGLFKKKVPIVNYEDIKPHIERIANGEPSRIISAQPITELLTSSGTSGGQPKLMPSTAEDLDRKTFFYNLLIPVMNKYVDGLDQGKGMYLLFIKPEISTPSGLMARPVLTSYYKSSNFRNGLSTHLIFASAFLRAIKFLEDHWRELCSNIRTDFIEFECNGESWEGIIKKLWPRTKYIEVIVTGSMAQYIPTLEFYSGGLPLVSTMYASSECYYGINLKPLSKPSDVSYTLLPNMAYFEFLHVQKNNGEVTQQVNASSSSSDLSHMPHLCPALHVLNRKNLLQSLWVGWLYRYRTGDILMVTGFYNNAPQFRFVQRRNVVLSIDTDKTNEEDLLKAVTQAKLLLEPYGFLLTEYTSYADTSSIPGHYVLFWELKTRGNNDLSEPDHTIMEQCCSTVEESLDSVYRRCRRRDNSIGPLEIRIVKPGTFDALMDFCVSQGSSVNQYKTPRCIKSKEAIKILDSRVVGKVFSKRYASGVFLALVPKICDNLTSRSISLPCSIASPYINFFSLTLIVETCFGMSLHFLSDKFKGPISRGKQRFHKQKPICSWNKSRGQHGISQIDVKEEDKIEV